MTARGTAKESPPGRRTRRPSVRARLFLTYLAGSAVAHLVWETAQLPLYTIWSTGSRSELAIAVLHCTGGDILIALVTLAVAVVMSREKAWPGEGQRKVYLLTLALGLGYVVFSEWLNTQVLGAWAYTDRMPKVPLIGTGLSPLLQWVVAPTLVFLVVYHCARTPPRQDT